MKSVYFVVKHTVPQEHPNGVRVANLGLIFKSLGYDVHLLGFDLKPTSMQTYKDMKCTVWEMRGGSGFFSARKRDREQLALLKEYILQNGKPTIVVSGLYDCDMQRFLMSYCKKNKIMMVETICEWFDRNNFVGAKGFVKFLIDRYSLYIQLPKVKNFIAISSLHASYYREKGCNTVVIPTLVDKEDYRESVRLTSEQAEHLKIAYAGSPARKDYVVNAILALPLLSDEERSRLQLHFYGPDTEQLKTLGLSEEFLNTYRDNIVCHGRIPYAEVKSKIADADFTVLLRPNKRYANAGFPTKVGESMACGTPVIANITSDLGKYILDGKTGIVCRDETPEACADGFRRALAMTREEHAAMRAEALAMANASFDYRVYAEALNSFLNR